MSPCLGFGREKWVGIATLNFKIEFEDKMVAK